MLHTERSSVLNFVVIQLNSSNWQTTFKTNFVSFFPHFSCIFVRFLCALLIIFIFPLVHFQQSVSTYKSHLKNKKKKHTKNQLISSVKVFMLKKCIVSGVCVRATVSHWILQWVISVGEIFYCRTMTIQSEWTIKNCMHTICFIIINNKPKLEFVDYFFPRDLFAFWMKA